MVERRSSLLVNRTDYVLARLREDIRDGLIEPGASIRQIELGVRYGVSATPVREALRLLEAEGVIVYTAHRGATLREMTSEDTEDLFAMRAEVEGLATRTAVHRIEPVEIEELHRLQEVIKKELEGDADASVLYQLNRDFHFAIYDAASRVIASQIRSLWALGAPSRSTWSEKSDALAAVRDHEAILHAIEAGEADAARALMSAHIFPAANRARMRAETASKTLPLIAVDE